jgi:hypothetical protein
MTRWNGPGTGGARAESGFGRAERPGPLGPSFEGGEP